MARWGLFIYGAGAAQMGLTGATIELVGLSHLRRRKYRVASHNAQIRAYMLLMVIPINKCIKRLNGANRTENFVVLIYSPNMWARNHCSLLQGVVHAHTFIF